LLLASVIVGAGVGAAPRRADAAGGQRLYAWGYNRTGQLGNGGTADSPAPLAIPGFADAVAVAIGEAGFTLVARADGSVWSWGANFDGELGDGTVTSRTTPAPIPGLRDVIGVAAGYYHGLAVTRDGTVWAWGSNSSGQLGRGSFDNDPHPTPQQIGGLGGVVAVAGGADNSLALLADGTVRGWGQGQFDGQYVVLRPTPAPVAGVGGIVAIAAGVQHRLALGGDGTLWAWGGNSDGQLGLGTRDDARPTRVPGLPPLAAIAASDYFSLAADRDGCLWSWGANTAGDLGLGTQDDNPHPTPARVPGVAGVRLLAGGKDVGVAVATDGVAYGWGYAIVNGAATTHYTPQPLARFDGATAVAAGTFTAAVVAAGSAAVNPADPAPTAPTTPRASVLPTPSLSPVSSVGPVAGPTPTPAPGQLFADVPPAYWAYQPIQQFARRGITTGCDTAVYCPERGVTRAEMAVFLDRTLGFPNPAMPASPRFGDVPPAYWAYAFIDQFATLGITTGCGGTEFCPDRGVTRSEMAAFLIRALKQPQVTPAAPTFADVPTTHPQFGYVEALVKAGVTTGCGDDDQGHRLYCPDRGVTRAEMAVFITRAFPHRRGQTGATRHDAPRRPRPAGRGRRGVCRVGAS